MKIGYSSMIAMFNLHPVLKANRFYLQNCPRDDDSRISLFLTENGRTRHSDVICLRPNYQSLGKFLCSWCVKLMLKAVCKVSWRYLISFLAMGRNVEGAVSPPPPSG